MNITILTGLEKQGDACDPVVDQVAGALRENDHEVSILKVYKDVREIVDGLDGGGVGDNAKAKPELVFNLLESFGTNTAGDVAVTGLLDLLGVRYTGGGPGELYLRQDKGLAKKVFAFENILYPHFAVFSQNSDFETGGNLRMPLFVKPLTADASIGIDGESLVRDSTALMKRVLHIHEKVNREPVAFPPIEMDFSGLPEGAPRVLGSKAKWSPDSPEYKGTQSILPDLPDELRARLQKTALDAARAVRVRDYGRVDLRLTDTGDIYVIEVNANCYLESSGEFAVAGQASGLEYPALIQKIVDLAVERQA
jgi:D-alanine-D-alanine ligase